MPKKKLKSIAKLRKDADDAFSLWIRTRDNFRCFYAGAEGFGNCGGYLQCSHIIGKGACPALRYEPNNAVTVCRDHHLFGWHSNNPAPYVNYLISKMPENYKWLEEQFMEYKTKTAQGIIFKQNREYFMEIIKTFKNPPESKDDLDNEIMYRMSML